MMQRIYRWQRRFSADNLQSAAAIPESALRCGSSNPPAVRECANAGRLIVFERFPIAVCQLPATLAAAVHLE
jgi:hypothetical protein